MAKLCEGLDLNIDEWFPDLDLELPLIRGVKTKNLKLRQGYAYDRFKDFYCHFVDIHHGFRSLYIKKEFYTRENVDRVMQYIYYAEKVVRRNVRAEESLVMRAYLKKFYEGRFETVRRLLNKNLKEREKELRQASKGVSESTNTLKKTKPLIDKYETISVEVEI